MYRKSGNKSTCLETGERSDDRSSMDKYAGNKGSLAILPCRETRMVNKNGDLGRMLKRWRVAAALTLAQLSAASGVSISHLARIERGERFPSANILCKIARPLGLSESEIFVLAGYLPPQATGVTENRSMGIDPYVSSVLSQEPVEIQRAVITILSVIKSMVRAQKAKD